MATFSCPSCNKSYQLVPSQAGVKFECTGCGQKIKVPTPPQARTVLGAVDERAAEGAVRPQVKAGPPPVPARIEEVDILEEDRGVLAMVLGIVACVLCLLMMIAFWPLVAVSLGLGVTAWTIAARDLKNMREGYMSKENKGFAVTGFVCGIVATCLSGAVLLFCGVFAALFASIFVGRMAF